MKGTDFELRPWRLSDAVLKRGAIKNGSIVDLHYYSILK
jgi:hypothetical protein